MADLSRYSPSDLRMVSRLAYKLAEDYAGILGADRVESLKALRDEIQHEIGEHPLPQLAPRGVIRLPRDGMHWQD